jgi:hypothetical protein
LKRPLPRWKPDPAESVAAPPPLRRFEIALPTLVVWEFVVVVPPTVGVGLPTPPIPTAWVPAGVVNPPPLKVMTLGETFVTAGPMLERFADVLGRPRVETEAPTLPPFVPVGIVRAWEPVRGRTWKPDPAESMVPGPVRALLATGLAMGPWLPIWALVLENPDGMFTIGGTAAVVVATPRDGRPPWFTILDPPNGIRHPFDRGNSPMKPAPCLSGRMWSNHSLGRSFAARSATAGVFRDVVLMVAGVWVSFGADSAPPDLRFIAIS